MEGNIRIAREMLKIAKELVAVSDFSKRNTFNKAMGTKLNTTQFKEVSKAINGGEGEGDLSNDTLDKVAEELLQVASELLSNKGE